MRLSQSNAGAAGRLGGVGGGGGGPAGRGTGGGDAGRAGVADGADRPPVEPGRAVAASATRAVAPWGADVPRRAVLERSAAPAAGPACRPRAAPALAARLVAARLALRAVAGSGRTAAAGGEAGGDGAASRDSWVTRERSSSISFSCDSTTRRSVSSRRARPARRHPGCNRQNERDDEQDQREEKNLHCSSSSCRRSSAGRRFTCRWGSLILHGATVAGKLSLMRTPQAACRPCEKP